MADESSSYNQQFGSEKTFGLNSGSSSASDQPDAGAASQTPPVTPTQEWKNGQFFKVGELISYGSAQYQCLRAHTAQPEFAPGEGYSPWAKL
ncbi:carbohydrate-binding protein [Streptomyces xanthochromogenes]|uniref:Chitin-binding type-3 domain-containing protein n=1 Tax=Streptomyces xanthochromogenes TaxID=67384 RepID=A0ABQ2ZWV4_9ACTN|nr:carbohydrate-binding protein [Streptomyces xanthochromogenes]GGY25462.1 hypothetical protein GCM10010326_19130 [Streptomyces xanthochromogenes]